ncbi:RecX family transcriptional regulator [Candidatus Saccharibacteria bacterium]|nr:RecX family transcriptional regulator [Candidatus Saccharibacteria bacterium]
MALEIHDIFEPELDRTASTVQSYQITDIREAVRDKNRVNIYLDGKFFCSLDISQVVDFKIKIGRKLDKDEREQIKRASEFGKLYARALEYNFQRPHSTWEIQDYLKRKTMDKIVRVRNRKTGEYVTKLRKGYDPGLIPLVMERLDAHGYLDDERFARLWVENRNTRKGISRKKLRLELQQKGIDSKIIDKVLGENLRDERDELRKVIAKRQKRYDDQQKFIQYLVRQGFNYSDVLDELSREADDSSSWPA